MEIWFYQSAAGYRHPDYCGSDEKNPVCHDLWSHSRRNHSGRRQ